MHDPSRGAENKGAAAAIDTRYPDHTSLVFTKHQYSFNLLALLHLQSIFSRLYFLLKKFRGGGRVPCAPPPPWIRPCVVLLIKET